MWKEGVVAWFEAELMPGGTRKVWKDTTGWSSGRELNTGPPDYEHPLDHNVWCFRWVWQHCWYCRKKTQHFTIFTTDTRLHMSINTKCIFERSAKVVVTWRAVYTRQRAKFTLSILGNWIVCSGMGMSHWNQTTQILWYLNHCLLRKFISARNRNTRVISWHCNFTILPLRLEYWKGAGATFISSRQGICIVESLTVNTAN
jgi:hypothetical protein